MRRDLRVAATDPPTGVGRKSAAVGQRTEVDRDEAVHRYRLPVELRGPELLPPHSLEDLGCESVTGILEHDRINDPSALVDDRTATSGSPSS